MESVQRKRIQNVLKRLRKGNEKSCFIVSAAPCALKTRDQFYPYRQDSDFFYLTGITEAGIVLLISTERKAPILFAPPLDKVKALWEGATKNYRSTAHALGAEYIVTKDLWTEVRNALKGHDVLYHQNRSGSISERLARDLQALPSHARGTFPSSFAHIDGIIEPMRMKKDRSEIAMIKEAAAITAHAILGSASVIKPGIGEHVVARTVDYWFGVLGAVPGFETIAATGKSAATLHYHRLTETQKKGELFLLDCGAEYNLYNADITRTFPVGGKFSPEQRDIYGCVLAAQKAAIKKVRHGVLVRDVYNAAVSHLVDGLIDLKVLKGGRSHILARKSYKQFFPHGIGHSLGIDVHDVGKHRGNNDARLEEGMVFTIEPGLYFPKKIGKLAPFGIRIEDDVLVKRAGCEVLTSMVPKEADDLEVLISG